MLLYSVKCKIRQHVTAALTLGMISVIFRPNFFITLVLIVRWNHLVGHIYRMLDVLVISACSDTEHLHCSMDVSSKPPVSVQNTNHIARRARSFPCPFGCRVIFFFKPTPDYPVLLVNFQLSLNKVALLWKLDRPWVCKLSSLFDLPLPSFAVRSRLMVTRERAAIKRWCSLIWPLLSEWPHNLSLDGLYPHLSIAI